MAPRQRADLEGLTQAEKLGLQRAILRSRGFSVKASEGAFRNLSPARFRAGTGIDKAQYDALKAEYLDRRYSGERGVTFALGEDIRQWILSRPLGYFERRYGFENEPTRDEGQPITIIQPGDGRSLLPEDYPVGLAKVLARFDYYRKSLDKKGLLDTQHIDELEVIIKQQGSSVKQGRKARKWNNDLKLWGQGEAMYMFWDTP